MPTIQQQETDRRKLAAEAAALLLLLNTSRTGTATYSLPTLIANAKVKPQPFRRIEPTEALRSNVAAPYFDVARAWAGEREAILAAYSDVLPARGEPLASDAIDSLQRAIDAAERRIAARIPTMQARMLPALRRLADWHRTQWIQRIKSATTVDVGPLTGQSEVQPDVANAVSASAQSIKAAHSDIANKISGAMVGGLLATIPAAQVATSLSGVLTGARKRAARSGVDAANGLVGALTRSRRIAAGLETWKWRHSPAVRYPRPIHVARDGMTFSNRNQPSEKPGQLIGCQCWEEPILG